MQEEIDFLFDATKDDMDRALSHMEKALVKIRAGRANPSMLEGVMVEYYGTPTPLQQVSNVNTPDARTISIQPWEKALIPEILLGLPGPLLASPEPSWTFLAPPGRTWRHPGSPEPIATTHQSPTNHLSSWRPPCDPASSDQF